MRGQNPLKGIRTLEPSRVQCRLFDQNFQTGSNEAMELFSGRTLTTGSGQQLNNNGIVPCMCCIFFGGLTQTQHLYAWADTAFISYFQRAHDKAHKYYIVKDGIFSNECMEPQKHSTEAVTTNVPFILDPLRIPFLLPTYMHNLNSNNNLSIQIMFKKCISAS